MSASWVSWKLKACLGHSCLVVQVEVELALMERGPVRLKRTWGKLPLSLHLQVMCKCKSWLSSGN